jgi:hypothetical protein
MQGMEALDADQSVSEAILKNHSKVTANTHGSL